LDVDRFRRAERRDGQYILRTNLTGEAPEELWAKYIQLTQVEAAFKCLKSDLALRPIFHWVEPRVEAHILVAFLAYSLAVTLRERLQVCAPDPSPVVKTYEVLSLKTNDLRLCRRPKCENQVSLRALKQTER
jgi:hypothetical protein